ncbi:hypothetical protein M885DRAFT_509809 [Pelagophyceae sp. CCMP2097]|nr:hypothetical protein M885DRAFT_509809 [Pelagophyceae sp. CCMP2097]
MNPLRVVTLLACAWLGWTQKLKFTAGDQANLDHRDMLMERESVQRAKNARAKTAHETMQRSKKTNLESAKNTRDINAKTKAQSQKTESRRKKAAMKTKHNLKAKQRSSRGEM